MDGFVLFLSLLFQNFPSLPLLQSQDFTGVPAVVDLACMRDAMNKLGSDSNKINPLVCIYFFKHLYLLSVPVVICTLHVWV